MGNRITTQTKNGKADRIIYVRIPEEDATLIEKEAEEEGLKYYMQVARILHKHADKIKKNSFDCDSHKQYRQRVG